MLNGTLLQNLKATVESRVDQTARSAYERYPDPKATQFLGVPTPLVREIANQYYQEVKTVSFEQLLSYCQQLLALNIWEYKIIAFDWSYRGKKHYRPAHFAIFEQWIQQYLIDWSDCDDLCTHSVGEFLLKYPEFVPQTKIWAISPNQWVRRAAAVSLIVPVKRGKYLVEVLEIADLLLTDREDLVQKGYGWLLKEATKVYPQAVFDYVMARKARMPRTALRYAIEKLTPTQRETAMARD